MGQPSRSVSCKPAIALHDEFAVNAKRMRAPCTGDVYARTSALVDAIDGVAEALTGDRQHFWLEPSTNAHFK